MTRARVFFLLLLLVVSGCGTIDAPQVVPDDVISEDIAEEVEPAGYVNAAYYYQFDPPEDVQLLALSDAQTATLADEVSDIVFLILDETNLFTVRAIEDTRSVHEWLSQEFGFFYPTGEAGQWVDELGGNQAIYLSGSGTVGSPARVIVSRHGEHLIVISYDREEEQFEAIVDSFEFI
jgi:hypothetical protein